MRPSIASTSSSLLAWLFGAAGSQHRACGAEHGGERVGLELELELAQDRGERGVRQLAVAELDAVADQHARATGARALRELRQQARLADAGLAAHQDGRRLACTRRSERRVERLQLLGAADEDRTRHAPGHRSIIAAAHGPPDLLESERVRCVAGTSVSARRTSEPTSTTRAA